MDGRQADDLGRIDDDVTTDLGGRKVTGLRGTLMWAWGSLAVVAGLSRSGEVLMLGCCVLAVASVITWANGRHGRTVPSPWARAVTLGVATVGSGFLIWASSSPGGFQEGALMVLVALVLLTMTSLARGLVGRAGGVTTMPTVFAVIPFGIVVLACAVVSLEVPLRLRFEASRSEFDELASAITSAPYESSLLEGPITVGSFTVRSVETFELWTIETPIEERTPPDQVYFVTGSGVFGFCTTGFRYVAQRAEDRRPSVANLGGGWQSWQQCF